MSKGGREPLHFAYIDTLRGLAFLGVLFAHCAYSCGHFPGSEIAGQGAYGVQLFFLASAITLCFSLATRKEGKREYAHFYLRRLFRIAPLFWLSMVFYWTFPGVIPHLWLAQWAPKGVHDSYFLLTALFLHGWHPYTFNSIVPGGWSIAVEMTFYLVFPFCFHRITTLRKGAFCLLLGVAFTVAEMFMTHRFASRIWPDASKTTVMDFFVAFWFPSQFVVFLAGILVYFLLNEPAVRKLYASRFWSCWLLAVSGMFLLNLLEDNTARPLSLILIVLALSGIIISLAGNSVPLMVNPLICHLGKLSYSCYLTHFAALGLVLKGMRAVFPQYALNVAGTVRFATGHGLYNLALFALMAGATLTITVAFSTLTHHLIENPGIALGKSLIRKIDKPYSTPKMKATSTSPPLITKTAPIEYPET